MKEINLLIIDDDQAFGERLAKAFSDRQYQVNFVCDLNQARLLNQKINFTHAIVDLRLAQESGLDIIENLTQKSVRVIILTGYGSVASALEAVRRGAANYLQKPASVSEIEIALFGPPLGQTNSAIEAVPTLSKIEWEHIQRVLHDSNGNITHAASKLGLHRQALQRKLKSPPPHS